MQKIYLASTSPRRKQLLEQIRLDFEVVSSDYEEDMTLKMEPKKLAKHLSNGKAIAVAQNYKNGIVIAADTFVVLRDKLLGKPHTANVAQKMLQQISGKQVSIITGFTVIDIKNKKKISKVSEAKVFIKKLTSKEINNYIKTGEPLDKAGAFGIQELGALIVRKVEGDYFATVGLPLYDLGQVLKKFGVEIF